MSQPDHATTPEPMPRPPTEGVDAQSVLLLTPGSRERCARVCAEHLHVPGEGEEAVVFVTFTQPPEQRLQVLHEHARRHPARVYVVRAGGGGPNGSGDAGGAEVRTVENPGDLARLGVRVSDALSECTDEHQTSLSFHSLTALLQFAELSRVFRFLYTLSGRVASCGARAHFHLDPVAHEERTVATLSPLFETVVRVGPNGIGDVH